MSSFFKNYFKNGGACKCLYIYTPEIPLFYVFLLGAGWDSERQSLCEPNPMELICNMPIIHFKPIELKKKNIKGTFVFTFAYFVANVVQDSMLELMK